MPNEPGILVIDDNPADARLIREALDGIAIDVAEDAPSALERLSTAAPRLVLLDLSLPGMNGHELLAEIRARHQDPSLPVVIFSSSDSPDDIHRAYSGSANCYVTKPAELDRFVDTVRRVVHFWLPSALESEQWHADSTAKTSSRR